MRTFDNLRRGTSLRPISWYLRLATALLIGLAPLAAWAATIAVTSPDDTLPTAVTTCTLRQAILSMNAGSLKGNCANTGAAFGSGNLITFAAAGLTGGANSGGILLADSADTTGAVGGALVVTVANLTIDASSWPTLNPSFPGSVLSWPEQRGNWFPRRSRSGKFDAYVELFGSCWG